MEITRRQSERSVVYGKYKRCRVSLGPGPGEGLSNSWQGRGLVHGDCARDGPPRIVAVRIVRVGRGPISCSILCHSATANRVTVEGTVTQLRQRARWVLTARYKSRKPPDHGTTRITDRQIERSTNQPSYNGIQGI